MSKPERLADHALVMGHVQPQVVGHRMERHRLQDVLRRAGIDPSQMPPDADMEVVGAGEPVVFRGAAHSVGDGKFVEIPWHCGCGTALHADPARLLRTWARHVEQACEVDADHLEEHYVAELKGYVATAVCACGAVHPASSEDVTNPDSALDGWERHVRGEA